jgi:beta-phosphoglucomutase
VNLLDRKTGFLFDLDGTLVDSSPLHERIFREVLRDRAPRFLEGFDYELLKGKSTAQSFRELGAAEGPLLECLTGEKQRRYRAAVLAGGLNLTPGAREILEFLSALGKRLFVVTGGSRRSVEVALEATGISRYFEGVITADEAPRGKPSPDSFLLCLSNFGIAAGDALGIEDSSNGLSACHAAGLDAVLVNNPLLRRALPGLGRARAWVFSDLAEFHRALIRQPELANA